MNYLIATSLVHLSFVFALQESPQTNSVASDTEAQLRSELKELEPYVGAWQLETKTKDGTPVKAKSEFLVGIDGNFLVQNMFYRNEDGKEYQEFHAVWRWDNASKKIVCHQFSRDGSHQALKPVIQLDDNGKPSITTVTAKPGSPVALQETTKMIDDKSYRWTAIVSGAKDAPAMEGIWKKD